MGQDKVGGDTAGDSLLDGHQLLFRLLDAKMQIVKVTPAQEMKGGRLKKGKCRRVQTSHSAKVSVHTLAVSQFQVCML